MNKQKRKTLRFGSEAINRAVSAHRSRIRHRSVELHAYRSSMLLRWGAVGPGDAVRAIMQPRAPVRRIDLRQGFVSSISAILFVACRRSQDDAICDL